MSQYHVKNLVLRYFSNLVGVKTFFPLFWDFGFFDIFKTVNMYTIWIQVIELRALSKHGDKVP